MYPFVTPHLIVLGTGRDKFSSINYEFSGLFDHKEWLTLMLLVRANYGAGMEQLVIPCI
uniref:Uncharacterized protein n=1 Tax=Arundo donax TaxID=35708 RepID=A0A0A8ZSI2_ARUDO